MKKLIAIILACLLTASIVGCSSQGSAETTAPAESQATETTAPAETETTPAETEAPGYEGTRKTLFWYSDALKMDCNYSVYLPASYDENDKTEEYP